MKVNRLKIFIRISVFFSILCISLCIGGELFREKQTRNRLKEATTDWINEFYLLPDNSLDFVFLGTSHSFCTVDPNRLWNENGITAYDLSSSAQDINATCLYMKTALKTQTPKAVFVEMRSSIIQDGTDEPWNRLAYDNLPFSKEKVSSILKSMKEEESLISYLFPIFRYHARWKNLNSTDFEYITSKKDNNYALNGFFIRHKITPVSFTKFYDSPPSEWSGLSEDIQKTILEMQAICSEKGIDLILWKAPSPMWRNYYHTAISEFADKNEITFLDLNYCMDTIGLDTQTDFLDANSHLNFSGAQKVTDYLASWIKERYELKDKRLDNSGTYDNWKRNYQYYLQTILFSSQPEITEYLNFIIRPEYKVFFAVNDGVAKMPNDIQQAFKRTGVRSSFEGADTSSFLAVMDGGEIIYEKISNNPLSISFEWNDNQIEMESKGWKVGDDASIKINGKDYLLKGQRGMGIVVYDSILGEIIDSVTFDIKENSKCHRNTLN